MTFTASIDVIESVGKSLYHFGFDLEEWLLIFNTGEGKDEEVAALKRSMALLPRVNQTLSEKSRCCKRLAKEPFYKIV